MLYFHVYTIVYTTLRIILLLSCHFSSQYFCWIWLPRYSCFVAEGCLLQGRVDNCSTINIPLPPRLPSLPEIQISLTLIPEVGGSYHPPLSGFKWTPRPALSCTRGDRTENSGAEHLYWNPFFPSLPPVALRQVMYPCKPLFSSSLKWGSEGMYFYLLYEVGKIKWKNVRGSTL